MLYFSTTNLFVSGSATLDVFFRAESPFGGASAFNFLFTLTEI